MGDGGNGGIGGGGDGLAMPIQYLVPRYFDATYSSVVVRDRFHKMSSAAPNSLLEVAKTPLLMPMRPGATKPEVVWAVCKAPFTMVTALTPPAGSDEHWMTQLVTGFTIFAFGVSHWPKNAIPALPALCPCIQFTVVDWIMRF